MVQPSPWQNLISLQLLLFFLHPHHHLCKGREPVYYFFRQVYYILFIYLAVSVLSCVMQDLLL